MTSTGTGPWASACTKNRRAAAVDAVWPQVAYAFLLLRRGLFSRAAALIQAATAGLGDALFLQAGHPDPAPTG
jgi:hypothetical protein